MMLWTMLADMLPHQQSAAIIMRLGGSAREVTRALSVQEITQGGPHPVTGQQLDPVSYILAGLEARYGQLDDETRVAAMAKMLAFRRYPNEHINELLTRYDLVRDRAQTEGNFVMSIEGCALFLLQICHTSPHQLMNLMEPFNGRLHRMTKSLDN